MANFIDFIYDVSTHNTGTGIQGEFVSLLNEPSTSPSNLETFFRNEGYEVGIDDCKTILAANKHNKNPIILPKY